MSLKSEIFTLVKKKLFKMHLFHTKYTANPLTYLLSTILVLIKLYLEFFFITQCIFLNIKPKMCLMSLLV